jgi:Holliday junction resolvase-like predicted endonuclease
MAKIYRNENLLRKKAKRQLLSILFTWLSYFMLTYLITNIVGIGFFISSLTTIYFVRRYKITRAGIKGEEEALSLVSKLGDDYHVFSNLKVEFENKESETDLIVVGKKGVFVIEVKNHNGTIIGDAEEKIWKQHKVGKRGGRYSADLYNPTKQVGTHVWRLSKSLREENMRTWVQGVAFFVNPNVKVEVDSRYTPVLTLEKPFVDYIKNLEVSKELDDQMIRKVVSFLKSKI